MHRVNTETHIGLAAAVKISTLLISGTQTPIHDLDSDSTLETIVLLVFAADEVLGFDIAMRNAAVVTSLDCITHLLEHATDESETATGEQGRHGGDGQQGRRGRRS